MSHFDEVLESPEWAFAFAAALEQQLGEDRILTVGTARASVAEVMGDEPSHSVTLRFTTGNGYRGSIALDANAAFASALEGVASDGVLSTPCVTAFEAAIGMIAEQAVVVVDAATEYEIDADTGTVGDEEDDVDIAVFPLLDGGDILASLALTIDSNAQSDATDPITPAHTSNTADNTADAVDSTELEPVAPRAASIGATSAPSYVLADVEMGVTAELGRCRMTMRDLLSITPGAVIDLDRPAGAPVDVLVNGTLIARGEVVVVDEEFGIRISELVPQPAAR